MKNYLIVLGLLCSCNSRTEADLKFKPCKDTSVETMNINSPLESIIKFNSMLENCVVDSSILDYINVRVLFHNERFQKLDSLSEMEIWGYFIKGHCSDGINYGKNPMRYFEYEISEFRKKDTLIIKLVNEHNSEIYKLKKYNKKWKIIKIIYDSF